MSISIIIFVSILCYVMYFTMIWCSRETFGKFTYLLLLLGLIHIPLSFYGGFYWEAYGTIFEVTEGLQRVLVALIVAILAIGSLTLFTACIRHGDIDSLGGFLVLILILSGVQATALVTGLYGLSEGYVP